MTEDVSQFAETVSGTTEELRIGKELFLKKDKKDHPTYFVLGRNPASVALPDLIPDGSNAPVPRVDVKLLTEDGRTIDTHVSRANVALLVLEKATVVSNPSVQPISVVAGNEEHIIKPGDPSLTLGPRYDLRNLKIIFGNGTAKFELSALEVSGEHMNDLRSVKFSRSL